MKLWEIDEKIRSFEYEIDEETGEILNPYGLDDLMIEREEKLEGIALYIKELRAEADAITSEYKTLKERADKRKNKADNLESYLDYALAGKKFSTPRCEVTYRRSERVEIFDEKLIPKKYLRITEKIEPDKAEIKKAIKANLNVEGAKLLEVNNISVK